MPDLRVVSRPDAVTHLVCCRTDPWERAFCGEATSDLNEAVEALCTMCLEEAATRRPGWAWTDPPTCPFDGQPCPDELEQQALIARRTGRPVPEAAPEDGQAAR